MPASSFAELEVELRRAIARDELTMAIQPIVNVGDERIVGVEALLRWNHPERGAIRPDLFIPIAEQSGLMTVLGPGCCGGSSECRDWPTCDISVNLSPLQIMAGNFVATMAGLLKRPGSTRGAWFSK
jgi:EAL domain-containing protein (putative c-di-GMP-specific phosphodiesterase class I)